SAGAVHEPEMPLVPGPVLVLVDDAAGDREGVSFEAPAGANLDGGGGERQVGHLAHRLQVDVAANDDRAAVRTGRLHRAGPAELYGRRTVRTGPDRASHRWLKYMQVPRASTPERARPRRSLARRRAGSGAG